MGTHQPDLVQFLLPQLFASAFVLIHARSRHRRREPLRVSFIEQSLGGHCCRFCVPGCTGTDTASPNCHCRSRAVCCASCARGNHCLDLEPEGFDCCSIYTSWVSNIL